MERIKISGRNKSIHNCIDCGNELTFGEYLDVRDRCLSCRLASHEKISSTYLTSTGENDINSILEKKREEI